MVQIRQLAAQAQYTTAMAQLEELLAQNPNHVSAHLFKGVLYAKQGDTARAIDTFRELARTHPKLPEPYNNLAVLYAAQSRYEEARGALLKAIELQPDYDTAQENLGDVYTKLATLAYDEAYRLNKRNTRAREKSMLVTQAVETDITPTPPANPVSPVQTAEVKADAHVPPVIEKSTQATPSAQAKPNKTQGTCLRTGDFESKVQTVSIREWFLKQGIANKLSERENPYVVNYMVYVPPLPDWKTAKSVLQKMKANGLKDVAVIPRGDLKNAISVGVYRSHETAKQRATTIQPKGFETRIEPRYDTRKTFQVETLAPIGAISRRDFAGNFPKLTLMEIECR